MKIPLRQKAYEYVLGKIMSGELVPGTRLSEVAMAEEIGLSPTPLREAYRQLAAEGLVKYVPNSGIFVRDVSMEETAHLYETREAIETFCAGMAAMKMNALGVGELKSCLDEMFSFARLMQKSNETVLTPEQEVEYMKADARFHLLILKASGNPILMKTMRECHVLGRLLRFKRHKHTLHQVAGTLMHHYRVYKFIRDHDSAAAERAMRAHIRFSRETALTDRVFSTKEKRSEEFTGELHNFIYHIEKE
jgi:DNA-binding GntR family transcriptional regulator